jgi:hypothetical protein
LSDFRAKAYRKLIDNASAIIGESEFWLRLKRHALRHWNDAGFSTRELKKISTLVCASEKIGVRLERPIYEKGKQPIH